MVVAELLTRLGFEVDPRELNRGLNHARSSLQGFKSFLGKLALGVSVFQVGSSVLKTARELEVLNTQLKVMTGSPEKTQALFKGIIDYAKTTSFYVKDVTGSVSTMLQGMVSASDVMPKIKQLGDLANNSTQLNRLAYAYAQVNRQGYMTNYESRRFLQGGNFGVYQQYAMMEAEQKGMMTKGQEVQKGTALDKWLRARQGELFGMAKHHKFTIDMLDQAIAYATSKGGIFYRHQLEQVKTFEGAWSNMWDVLSINAGLALQKLFPIFKTIMRAITDIPLEWLGNAFAHLAAVVAYFGYVMKQEGILHIWEVLKQTFAEFIEDLPPGSDMIEDLAHILSFLARAVLFLTVGLVQLAKILMSVWSWMLHHKLMIAAVATLVAQLAVPAFLRWAGASTVLVGGLRTLGTLLLWLATSPITTIQIVISQLIPKIQAMWLAIAGGGIALPAIAAVLSVANAIRVLMDTMAENKALADNKEYAEGVTRIVRKRMANVGALKALEGKGNQYDGQRDDLQRRIAGNDKELADWKVQFGIGASSGGADGFDKWKADYDKIAGQTAAEATKQTGLLEAQNKKLDQIAGNTTPRGGVPNDVLRLADMSFRTHFNVTASDILLAAE